MGNVPRASHAKLAARLRWKECVRTHKLRKCLLKATRDSPKENIYFPRTIKQNSKNQDSSATLSRRGWLRRGSWSETDKRRENFEHKMKSRLPKFQALKSAHWAFERMPSLCEDFDVLTKPVCNDIYPNITTNWIPKFTKSCKRYTRAVVQRCILKSRRSAQNSFLVCLQQASEGQAPRSAYSVVS